eukprot:TRINITY_DN3161_c0_g1_i2.p1 TRINITY_DN3161_c0_g1~~TRINITY_DN3161_c0_g1_i2.p1  ORF type:complete len:468 (+),score=172.32 TRINITY_DN3161_c0_g1_i2:112-1515(+)
MEVARGRSSTTTPAWNKYHCKSPFSGRDGFGMPTPSKRTNTPSKTGHTPCRAVTPRSGTRRFGLISANRRLVTDTSKTKGCVTDMRAEEVTPRAVPERVQASEHMETQAAANMQVDDDVEMEDAASTGTSPELARTIERIEGLAQRALSQGMSEPRPGRESVATLPEWCEQLENMGVIRPSPSRNPFYCKMEDLITNSAKKQSSSFPCEPLTIQKEPTEEQEHMQEEEEHMQEDTPLKPSARKSVSFRYPLTDEKPKKEEEEEEAPRSPSPAVTMTTPRARLSFVTDDDSLEKEGDEACVVYEADSPCESIITTLENNRASTAGVFEMRLHQRQSVLTIVREESECSSVSERPMEEDENESEDKKVDSEAGEVDPYALSYKDLQQLAKKYGVPCKGKKEQLARAVAKAIVSGPPEEDLSEPAPADTEHTTDDLDALSYREVQAMAKEMGLNAGGKKDAILARIREAL